MDLELGLSVRLNAAFVADVMYIEETDGRTRKLIRQEYSGMVTTVWPWTPLPALLSMYAPAPLPWPRANLPVAL